MERRKIYIVNNHRDTIVQTGTTPIQGVNTERIESRLREDERVLKQSDYGESTQREAESIHQRV